MGSMPTAGSLYLQASRAKAAGPRPLNRDRQPGPGWPISAALTQDGCSQQRIAIARSSPPPLGIPARFLCQAAAAQPLSRSSPAPEADTNLVVVTVADSSPSWLALFGEWASTGRAPLSAPASASPARASGRPLWFRVAPGPVLLRPSIPVLVGLSAYAGTTKPPAPECLLRREEVAFQPLFAWGKTMNDF